MVFDCDGKSYVYSTNQSKTIYPPLQKIKEKSKKCRKTYMSLN